MPAKPPCPATQEPQEGGEGVGGCHDAGEAESGCSVLEMAAYGEPIEWWPIEAIEALNLRDRYRAALARGVWWG